MSKRLRRILLRILIPLVVLVAILLAAFTWFAFWPLEGSVDQMASLVPADVDFVYRTSWAGLKDTGWLQENLQRHPVVPQVGELLREVENQLLEVEAIERQINSQIPLGVTTFSVEKDLLGSELIASGRFCEGSGPERGAPRWRELLVLTRITWKPKFISALKHEFVREQVGPDVTITDEGDHVFKLVFRAIRPTSLADRSICGPGIVIPPQNVWYLTRVKDVLAFSNAEALIREVQYLAAGSESSHSYLDRPWITLDAPAGSIAASLDLHPLRNYLMKALERAGPPLTVLTRYLTIPALDRMNGRLGLPTNDMVDVQGEIRYQASQLNPGVRDVYALQPEALGAAVANLVPAEDTFGAFLIRTPPLHLIETIYDEILNDGDRRLWNENLRRTGRYEDIHEFFAEFASRLGDTSGVAVARLSDVYDTMEFPGFFDPDPAAHPDANWPAFALMVRLRQGVRPEELDAYLEERIPVLGGESNVEKETYRGLTYRRIRLEVQTADYATVEPAYILAQNHFIFASNETYFRKILDTMVDPVEHKPLSADPTFRETMSRLDEESHLTLFLDLEKLFRVPPVSEPEAQPRGFLWDQRSIWLRNERAPRNEAVRYRKQLLTDYTRENGRPADAAARAKIEEQVDRHWDTWLGRYPEFFEEYRLELDAFTRLRAFGLDIRADQPRLFVKAALLLRHEAAAE